MALEKQIQLQEGVTATLQGAVLVVKGPKGELKRKFSYPGVKLTVEGAAAKISTKSEGRKDKAVVGTWVAHIKNMVHGAAKGYEIELKTLFMHFPMTVKVEGREVVVVNFLGEKGPRKTKIVGDTKVEAQKEAIKVSGTNKEDVGQTAANIEQLCHKGARDIRVFQDGIYIVKKFE